MENKGYAINRPCLFKGERFNPWKQRMIALLESCHIDMWDIIENSIFTPLNREGEPMARSSWFEYHKLRYLLNSKAINILMCALCENKYKEVQTCKNAKDI